MLTFEDITINNWGKVSTSVMKSELAYKKSIRTSRIEYANILIDGDALGKIAFNGKDYVGNIIGYPPTKPELKDYKLDKPEHKCVKYIYIFNFVVANHYRGEGFGLKILREFLIKAKEMGYDKVIGHFRLNGSLALIKKFGAVEGEFCQNWENTKEDYVFCELDIRKLEIINPMITIKN